MKKISKLICFFFFLFLFSTKVYAYSDDYVISKYDININVNENNSFDITEKITVDFKNEKHGIIRKIPLQNEYHDNAKISNLKINENYTKSEENKELQLKIGDENKKIIGEKEYIIKYNYKLPINKDEYNDEFYFNIIGDDWDTTIDNITFKITMPKDFDKNEIYFTYGRYGLTDSELIKYTVNKNVIEGSYIGILDSYNAITVKINLPNKYFSLGFIGNLPFIIPIILTLISIIIFLIKGINKRKEYPVEYLPPKGLNSLDVSYIYKGKISNKAVVSLLICLAGKGYIKIIEDGKDIKLQKLKEYNERNRCERIFFEGLFLGKDSVYISSLKRRFYRTIDEIRKIKLNKTTQNKYFEKSNKYKKIILVNMILSFVISLSLELFFENIQIMLLLGLLLFIPSITLIFSKKYTRFLKIFMNLFSFIIFLGVAFIFVRNKSVIYIELICLLIMYLCLINIKKRTEYGNELLNKIRGFRKFLITVEKDKLKLLVEDNPNYFYDILPYAYVLGITNKYIRKFEVIALRDNTSISMDYSDMREFNQMQRLIDYNMNKICRTISTRDIESISGNYNYSSSSSSSSGYAGGGSGGGGGRAW